MSNEDIVTLSLTDWIGEKVYSSHFCVKQKGYKWLLFNSLKEQISDLLFDEITLGIDELKWARAVYEGKHGIINSEGKVLVDFKYDYVGDYLEDYKAPPQNPYGDHKKCDYIEVGIGEKRGVIDKNGNFVVEVKWDQINIWSFEPDFAVRDGKFWGVIDKEGNIKIPFNMDYDQFGSNCNNVVTTCKDYKYGFIKTNGDLIFPPIFDDLWPWRRIPWVNKTTSIVIIDGKYGLMDYDHKLIAPCKYDSIFFSENGLAGFNLGKKTGYLDVDGNEFFDEKNY